MNDPKYNPHLWTVDSTSMDIHHFMMAQEEIKWTSTEQNISKGNKKISKSIPLLKKFVLSKMD